MTYGPQCLLVLLHSLSCKGSVMSQAHFGGLSETSKNPGSRNCLGAHGRAGARGACERRWRAERGRGCLGEHVLPRESLRRARRGAGPRGDAWDDAGELACLDVAPSEQPTRVASGGSCRFQDGLVSPGPRRERVRRARAVATFLFHTHFPRNFGTWFRGPEKTNLNNFSLFSVFEILLCVAFDSSSIL